MKGNKKTIILAVLFIAGGVGATVIVYRAVARPGGGKSSSNLNKFSQLLGEKAVQDGIDDANIPDELRRAQMARGAGQFSDANYGKGSLGYVRGGGLGAKGGAGAGEDAAAAADAAASGQGAGSKSAGSNTMAAAMSKNKGGKFSMDKIGQKSGGMGGYNFGAGQGGAAKDGAKGKGTGVGEGQTMSASYNLSGKDGRSALGKRGAVATSKRGKGSGKRGAIGDLMRRKGIAYHAQGGAEYQTGALDQAMAGRGAGIAVGGITDDAGGIRSSLDAKRDAAAGSQSNPNVSQADIRRADCAELFCWSTEILDAHEPNSAVINRWIEVRSRGIGFGSDAALGGGDDAFYVNTYWRQSDSRRIVCNSDNTRCVELGRRCTNDWRDCPIPMVCESGACTGAFPPGQGFEQEVLQ